MTRLNIIRRIRCPRPALLGICAILYCCPGFSQSNGESPFVWPDGKRAAISFTFDDGRTSQVDKGLPLLREYGVRATFYITPDSVKQRLEEWNAAIADGHEIGNHSLVHPCSGNFPWSRHKALEHYTLDQMEQELSQASVQIEKLLGVKPVSFAYPCGQTYVGRGERTRSYVPVVARLFQSGRGWLDEAANDPVFCDMAQLTSMELDGKRFDEVLPLLESASQRGHWLILTGHEMGDEGSQTSRLETLRKAFEYLRGHSDDYWVAPVREVAHYVDDTRDPVE